MKYNTYIFLIGTSMAIDAAYDDSLGGCLSFAAEFDNTGCDQQTQYDYADVPTASHSYDTTGLSFTSDACPANGSVNGDGLCTYTRKLCITCFDESGQIRIRVQSNAMPNHAYSAPQAIVDNNIDYTVDWLQTGDAAPAGNLD